MANIDSAVLWPNGKVYFFSGSDYFRYDIATDRVDSGFPLPIQAHWPGLGGVSIQGAVVWPNGKAYFFSGSQYYRFDIAANQVDPGFPLPTNLNWVGVLAGPFNDHRIDAVALWPNGKAYLFQHDRYYSWDIASDKMDPGYPLMIQGNWPGLWITGQPFAAAFVWPVPVNGRQKAYFFQRALYLRYDVAGNQLDSGYPMQIQGNWPGL